MDNKFVWLFVIFAFVVIAGGCSHGKSQNGEFAESSNKLTDELILALGGEVDNGFDPTTGWGRYGSPLFQSTLLTYDKEFNIEKDLAVDYQVSDDGLEWIVTIRDDVIFTDGEPLTAEDIVFTYKTAKTS